MRSFLVPKIALFGFPATILTCCSVTAGYYWGGYADKNDLEQKTIDSLEKANEGGTKYEKSLTDEIETNKKYNKTLDKLQSAKLDIKEKQKQISNLIKEGNELNNENQTLSGKIALYKGAITKVKACFARPRYNSGTETNCLKNGIKDI